MMRRVHIRLRALLVFLAFALLLISCANGEAEVNALDSVVNAIPESDDELQNMSSAKLQELEEETLRKVKESDEHLHRLRSETDVLKNQQKDISAQTESLLGARNWEVSEKRKRDEELSVARSEVEKRQKKVEEMTTHVKEMKKRIDELRIYLRNLTAQSESAKRQFNAPSIQQVLDARSRHWSRTKQNLYHKTVDSFQPAFHTLSRGKAAYRRRVSSWPLLDLFASLLLYGFFIAGAFAARKAYLRVRGHFTIARLLFLGDTFCAAFWALMLVCYCFLWTDPLIAVQARSPRLFFVFQLTALIGYTNFVLLRVVLLASKLSLSALGETLAVVVVGHHYYERVWKPAILDQPIHGTFFYYFCYAWLFLAFAYNRLHEFAPLKQLRGPKLPPLMAIRVVFARFFSKGVPDGDLETRPFVDMEDTGDHES